MACWIAVLAVAVARVPRRRDFLSYLGDGGGESSGWRVTITGIAFSQNYSVERDVRDAGGGDSVTIHDYRFTFPVRHRPHQYRGGWPHATRAASRGGAARGETALAVNTSRMVI